MTQPETPASSGTEVGELGRPIVPEGLRRDHQARHGEREHRQRIQGAAPGDLGADDHVGDGDPEHDVEQGFEQWYHVERRPPLR